MPKNNPTSFDYREWRGSRQSYSRSYAKYEFPVTVRKIEPRKNAPKAANR